MVGRPYKFNIWLTRRGFALSAELTAFQGLTITDRRCTANKNLVFATTT
jgi:hypothetical protein